MGDPGPPCVAPPIDFARAAANDQFMGVAAGGAAWRRRLRAAEWVALCLGLVYLVSFGVGHLGLTRNHQGVDEAAAASADVVRWHWTTDQLRPAPSAGHICVADATHGRICASFAAGERPAIVLTHEIEGRGLAALGSPAP
jgi:hypothetical protein